MNTHNDAELERFFKKDIIEFLDKKLVLQGAKTEIQELQKLIKQNKFLDAGKIIEDAVDDFNNTDSEDVYKEIKYNKIIELVKIAHNYVKDLTIKNRLTEDISMLEKSGQLNQNYAEDITVFDERKKKEEEEEKEKEKKLRAKAQNIENDLIEINKKLFINLRKKDVAESIKNYREYKKKFQEFPSVFVDEKKEIYNDLIAYYMRIKKLNQELYEDNVKLQKIKPKKETIKKLKLEEIKSVVEDVKIQIRQENFKEAKTNIIHLKHKISLIPEKYKNIKNKLNNISNLLIKKLEFEKKLNQDFNKEKKEE